MGNVIKIKPYETLVSLYDLKGSTYERISSQQEIEDGKPKKDLNFIKDKIVLQIE